MQTLVAHCRGKNDDVHHFVNYVVVVASVVGIMATNDAYNDWHTWVALLCVGIAFCFWNSDFNEGHAAWHALTAVAITLLWHRARIV